MSDAKRTDESTNWRIGTQTIGEETTLSRNNEGDIFVKATEPEAGAVVIANVRLSEQVFDETKRGKYWQATCKIQEERAELIANAPAVLAENVKLKKAIEKIIAIKPQTHPAGSQSYYTGFDNGINVCKRIATAALAESGSSND